MGKNQKRGQPKNRGQFASDTRGAAAPTSAGSRPGLFSRMFGRGTKSTPQNTLDANNPFKEVFDYYDNAWNDFQKQAPTHTPAPRETPQPRPRATQQDINTQWADANAAARADYRYGAHETAHNRIASLLEAHDTNTHGPFTYTTHTGETVETPLDPDASARYIKTIASDIVELHDDQQTSDGLRGARNVYTRQTVELAREVVNARESSAAGPSVPDLYRLAQYEQSDGTTRNAWHLKPRVGMLLSAIERDQKNSAHLAHARNEETARRQAAEKRYSELPW